MCVFLSVFGLIYLVYQTFNVVYNLLKSSCNARPEKYATNSARAAAFHAVTSKCVWVCVCLCVCMLLSLSTKEFSTQLHFHMLNYLIHQTSYPSLASAVCRGGCSEWL